MMIRNELVTEHGAEGFEIMKHVPIKFLDTLGIRSSSRGEVDSAD